MYLSRVHLDPRCKEARRDLSDPYQLHSTLCRAFSRPDKKCPAGEFLWRLEPDIDKNSFPRILVQSRLLPDWEGIGVKGWLVNAESPIDLNERLRIKELNRNQHFRFRLRANPCVTRKGKRLGLMGPDEQGKWIAQKGMQHGFVLPHLSSFDLSEPIHERIDVHISQEQVLKGNRHSGNIISVFSVLYDGFLTITDPALFVNALQTGIGHGKVMGLGLLSVVPINGFCFPIHH